ncbi:MULTISPECIES: lipid IV(A) 3-deoxy-D-manno-octulosonic acid transferase [Gammaproteobacteria]|uniref:lipid IV(A) 3-deoxy-D-manno-octulosonic acid transferase n=1 Tax=Gammaproteobacteria TaxID=1236 RepID=UPI000DD042A1|nr:MULTISPECIES: lipid IV(A) 3-deoxy-D-manno-octulosonic acid transferase [Gammaproteobacteria]RTE87159.1 3-deoxy-D-manno-octulosonic acid transferase [Aliidiomarina sp. B3213]TCZ93053.1 3-deoxy-D-manno-octulosonic acid transferase [Lysobacter sp. N42]
MRDRLVRLLYSFIFLLYVPVAIFNMWRQGANNPDYRSRWRERFGYVTLSKHRPYLIHCASVGEFIAAKPLISRLVEENTPIWVTCTTPTASDLIQSTFGEKIEHSYLPTDLPWVMKRFLNRVQPKLIVLMETEVWPNLIANAQKRSTPVALINARMSESSFRGYSKVKGIFAPTWSQLDLCAVQNENYGQRFEALGVLSSHIQVLGNLKFDVFIPPQVEKDIEAHKALLNERQIFIGGSTHQGEEEILLKAFTKLLKTKPKALLILAPRHKERFAEVAELIKTCQLECVTRTSGRPVTNSTQVLLVDCMGELLTWYGVSTIAFIGGSLIERGGHNPLEAMTFGVPLLSGRHVFNFEEVYAQLDQRQAIRWVSDENSLHDTLLGLLTAPETARTIGEQAKSLFALHRGATARTHAALHQCVGKK